MTALIQKHSRDTGQVFSPGAFDQVWALIRESGGCGSAGNLALFRNLPVPQNPVGQHPGGNKPGPVPVLWEEAAGLSA